MNHRIAKATSKMIMQLYNNGNPNNAVLASLRTSQSVDDHNATDVWPVMFSNLESSDLSKNGLPTYAEIAVYTALRCFAIYQQGHGQTCMYASSLSDGGGQTLFKALAKLRQGGNLSDSLDKRIQNVLATNNLQMTINIVVQLISILKQQDSVMKIDFARLAQDLFYFQISPDSARRVHLMWGQEYFAQEPVVNKEK